VGGCGCGWVGVGVGVGGWGWGWVGVGVCGCALRSVVPCACFGLASCASIAGRMLEA
jgi:hypothetical protein